MNTLNEQIFDWSANNLPDDTEIPPEIFKRYADEPDAIQTVNNRRTIKIQYIPFRLLCQVALSRALKQITPGNGYTCDIRDVCRGKLLYGDKDPLPCIGIIERALPPDYLLTPVEEAIGTTNYVLIIQGFQNDDKKFPTDVGYCLMADIKERLAMLKEDEGHPDFVFRFGNKDNFVEKIYWDAGVVRPPDKNSACISSYLRVNLQLIEDNQLPYGAGPHKP